MVIIFYETVIYYSTMITYSIASTDTSGTEAGHASGSSGKGHSLPIGSKSPDDEEFSVISDDEVQNSRLSSSPSSGSPTSNEVTETRATMDVLTLTSLSESPPTNAEVCIFCVTFYDHRMF